MYESNLTAKIDIGAFMFCSKCGTQNDVDAKFCKKCAAELPEDATVAGDTEQDMMADGAEQNALADDDQDVADALEQTESHAETKPAHTDPPDLTNPDPNESNSEEKWSPRNKKIAGLLAGVALIAIVGGVVGYKVLNQNHPTTTTEETSPNKTPKTSTETKTQEKGVEAYAASMEKYKDMSVDAFEKLPRNERLAYSQYLIDASAQDYNKLYGVSGSENYGRIIKPLSLSVESGGQDIIDQYILTCRTAHLQYLKGDEDPRSDEEKQKNYVYDLPDGQKVLSSAYYSVGNNSAVSDKYLEIKNDLTTLNSPNAIKNNETCTNTSDMINGEDVISGEKVQYKTISIINTDGETFYIKVVCVTFTNYDGKPKTVWLIDDMAASSQQLNSLGSARQ